MPSDIAVTYPTKASVSINWTTNELADSEVSYSINGVWWKTEDPDMPDGPVRTVKDPTLKTEHSITLKKGFNLNRDYEFRIRSNNGQTGAKKIIWGSIISVEH